MVSRYTTLFKIPYQEKDWKEIGGDLLDHLSLFRWTVFAKNGLVDWENGQTSYQSHNSVLNIGATLAITLALPLWSTCVKSASIALYMLSTTYQQHLQDYENLQTLSNKPTKATVETLLQQKHTLRQLQEMARNETSDKKHPFLERLRGIAELDTILRIDESGKDSSETHPPPHISHGDEEVVVVHEKTSGRIHSPPPTEPSSSSSTTVTSAPPKESFEQICERFNVRGPIENHRFSSAEEHSDFMIAWTRSILRDLEESQRQEFWAQWEQLTVSVEKASPVATRVSEQAQALHEDLRQFKEQPTPSSSTDPDSVATDHDTDSPPPLEQTSQTDRLSQLPNLMDQTAALFSPDNSTPDREIVKTVALYKKYQFPLLFVLVHPLCSSLQWHMGIDSAYENDFDERTLKIFARSLDNIPPVPLMLLKTFKCFERIIPFLQQGALEQIISGLNLSRMLARHTTTPTSSSSSATTDQPVPFSFEKLWSLVSLDQFTQILLPKYFKDPEMLKEMIQMLNQRNKQPELEAVIHFAMNQAKPTVPPIEVLSMLSENNYLTFIQAVNPEQLKAVFFDPALNQSALAGLAESVDATQFSQLFAACPSSEHGLFCLMSLIVIGLSDPEKRDCLARNGWSQFNRIGFKTLFACLNGQSRDILDLVIDSTRYQLDGLKLMGQFFKSLTLEHIPLFVEKVIRDEILQGEMASIVKYDESGDGKLTLQQTHFLAELQQKAAENPALLKKFNLQAAPKISTPTKPIRSLPSPLRRPLPTAFKKKAPVRTFSSQLRS